MIRVTPVQQEDEINLENYRLAVSQMRFSGHPSYVLKRKRANYQPYVIFADDQLVGVFALETGQILKKMDAPDSAVYLRGLSIEQSHQGKGYFKETINALSTTLAPSVTDIYLMVNVKNDAAYYAFIKSGFIDQQKVVKQGFSSLKVLKKAIHS